MSAYANRDHHRKPVGMMFLKNPDLLSLFGRTQLRRSRAILQTRLDNRRGLGHVPRFIGDEPRSPKASPPKTAIRSVAASATDQFTATVLDATHIAAFPVKALDATHVAVFQAWLKTSMTRNSRMPIDRALRKPFLRGLTFWRIARGRPRKIVKPAMAPSNRSCA